MSTVRLSLVFTSGPNHSLLYSSVLAENCLLFGLFLWGGFHRILACVAWCVMGSPSEEGVVACRCSMDYCTHVLLTWACHFRILFGCGRQLQKRSAMKPSSAHGQSKYFAKHEERKVARLMPQGAEA
jgi:hypothetical protein